MDLADLSCGVMACSRAPSPTRNADFNAPLPSTGCRIAFAVTTGVPLRASVSDACLAWRSGGCGSASSRNASRPAIPEQNGSHEHFHSVLKAETARPPAPTLRAQQRRFDRFCAEYNHERPHESLADRPRHPVQALAARVACDVAGPRYPGHFEIRRVASDGCISWRQPVFLTETLAGQLVGFEEVDDGLWTLYFGSIPLARFDERRRRASPAAPDHGGAPADDVRARLKAKPNEKTSINCYPCPRTILLPMCPAVPAGDSGFGVRGSGPGDCGRFGPRTRPNLVTGYGLLVTGS